MRLDGMIFDLDGTLTDTFPVCFVAFREALQAFTGRSYTDEEIVARFGPLSMLALIRAQARKTPQA